MMNEQEKYDWMLCVRCFTYNHAPYIVDALNGFTMQETTFPYVCCIVDDASTDGQQDLIVQYMREHFDIDNQSETDDYRLTTARHKTNPNCWFALYFLKYNHYCLKKKKRPYIKEWTENSKYEALCEGDDYWTDKLKLQKQVDVMMNNPEIGMCFTANIRLSADGKSKENRLLMEDCLACSFEDYILSEYDNIDTCTMLYKTTLITDLPEWYKKVGVGDIPTKLVLFSRGKVGYINDITGCYRKGAVTSWSVRMQNSYRMRKNNQKRILQMWKDFDVWTEKKYHKHIVKKKYVLKKRYIKSEIVLFFYSMKRVVSHGK